MALSRARDDRFLDADEPVYAYLRWRGLMPSWEEAAFGIIAAGMPLSTAVVRWLRTGHRLIAPLYGPGGELMNVQARAIVAAQKKTLFPSGSQACGGVFASRQGRELLRGDARSGDPVLLAEGLTDYLALAPVVAVPLLAIPGTSCAAASIGSWVARRDLYLALDQDKPGRTATDLASKRAYELGAAGVFRLRWPGGAKDACEARGALGSEGLQRFLDDHIGGETDA